MKVVLLTLLIRWAALNIIEYLTNQIEEKVWDYLNKIEDMGGSLKAIELGYQKNEIERNAYEYQIELEKKEQIIVGVNEFITDHKEEHEILRIDEKVRNVQIENLKKLKQTRDNKKVNSILETIKQKAGTDENLLPYFLTAVESYATIGEISNVLREVWGEYKS